MTATDVVEGIFRMYLLKEQQNFFEKTCVLSSADYLKLKSCNGLETSYVLVRLLKK